jgi:hypothetical protein
MEKSNFTNINLTSVRASQPNLLARSDFVRRRYFMGYTKKALKHEKDCGRLF